MVDGVECLSQPVIPRGVGEPCGRLVEATWREGDDTVSGEVSQVDYVDAMWTERETPILTLVPCQRPPWRQEVG